MKKTLSKSLVLAVLLCPLLLHAADEKLNIKYGKIDAADFTLPDEEYLKSADAVYIADIGSTSFEGNSKGWFTLLFKRHIRIKINTNNGFDAADFEIPMYFESSGVERVVQLKGTTYNLENGKVVETSLKDDQVFIDKQNKKYWLKKFTMPAVKTGSIIDVVYTIESEFIRNLQGWSFQGAYPRMWSEYSVQIPELLDYVTLSQGYRKFDIQKQTEFMRTYSISNSSTSVNTSYARLDSKVFERRWVMKQVPSLKPETYTSAISNHRSRLEFQLSRIKWQNSPWDEVLGSYATLVKKLNENEYYGANLYKNNNWLDDDIKQITNGAKDTAEIAKKIYYHIRDSYTCTDSKALFLTDNGLKNIVKAKKGSAADLNLLLVAMLQHEGIQAYPVILSTRQNGFSNEIYPLLSRFDLTIAIAVVGDKEIYLDASDPLLGFGKLNDYCYNGHARVVAGTGIPIYLNADSLVEKNLTSMMLINTADGKWEGSLNSTLGYISSHDLRGKIKDKGKDNVIKSLEAAITGEVEIKGTQFDHLDDKDIPVTVKQDLVAKKEDDIIYLNPLLGEGITENPFKSAERNYPIEMPYAQETIYVANIEIPAGYKVDEVPKSEKVNLNDSDGMFTYLVVVQDNQVMLRSTLLIKKANFSAENYQYLRDFFGYVVSKHSEQVVFKKLDAKP